MIKKKRRIYDARVYLKYFFLFSFCFLISISYTQVSADSSYKQPLQVDGIAIQPIKDRIQLSEAEKIWLEKNKHVRVRVGDWPPFMITGNNVSGIAIDYLSLISKIHGIEFSYITQKDISWPDALQAIRDRNGVDMVPAIQPTADRSKYMIFSVPYQTLPWVIVTRSNADFVGGLKDIQTKKICVQEQFILQKEIEKDYPDLNLKVIKTSTPTLDSLKEVATGRSYATINALPVVVYFIQHYGLSNLKVAAPAKFTDLQLTMGIRNDWPELASIISKTVKAMSQKDITAIQNTWLSVQYDQGFNPQKVRRWMHLGAIVFLIIVVLFIIVNRTLKRQVEQRTKDLQSELEKRKIIQQHLKNSEERYDMALRAVSDGLWDWDLKTNDVYFSPRYFEMLGYGPHEFPYILDTWTKLLHPDDKERVIKLVTAYLENFSKQNKKTIYSVEFRMKTSNGEWKWILARGNVPIVDEKGSPIRLIGTHIDITERKKTEEIMVQTEKMMSVGGLAAGMAHEINNPLSGILGAVQNIQNRIFKDHEKNLSAARECGADIAQIRKYVDIRGITPMLENIQTAGFRAAAIVHNMLQFSRKSNQNFELHDLAILLDKTLELAASDYNLKRDYDFRKIKIKREYDPKVRKIFCIGNEIQQVFLNLLKNGAEAMAEKNSEKKECQFILRVKNIKDEVIVEIEDNGPGMNEETKKRAFDPFYTTKSVGKGTGLGLSVSYFIITEEHNGSMEVESTIGEKTLFIIRFPADSSCQ
ncbi:ATP-binding protein [Maridesulfovibrio zosterae]|uniref:ATP-binding protein n=1 Tax=Maridesulfovibrio zosterae TaxID=82171 RepID=UPI00040BCCF4|nr:transporter substrate-binding domain-containing protein [Maridesulfovibrio zosterae]